MCFAFLSIGTYIGKETYISVLTDNFEILSTKEEAMYQSAGLKIHT